MLSTDRKIFEPASEVKARMVNYASELEELFIVVLGVKQPLRTEGKLKYLGLIRWQAFWWRPTEKFDLVTSQDPFETGVIARRLAKIVDAKLELQIHTDFLSPYFAGQSIVNWVRVRIAEWLLPKADKIRVVSQRIKNSLISNLQLPISKIEVRPIAIDLEKIKTATITVDLHKKYPQFKKIILMASRLEPEKNVKLAVAAMKLLKENYGLVIVGSGSQKIPSLPNVILESWQDKKTLFSYYKTADLFLLTSWYEGYGLVLAEAHAAGCPLVSTDVGVAREVGATITPDDPAALAKIILSKL